MSLGIISGEKGRGRAGGEGGSTIHVGRGRHISTRDRPISYWNRNRNRNHKSDWVVGKWEGGQSRFLILW